MDAWDDNPSPGGQTAFRPEDLPAEGDVVPENGESEMGLIPILFAMD